jgi:hypothetical protein
MQAWEPTYAGILDSFLAFLLAFAASLPVPMKRNPATTTKISI